MYEEWVERQMCRWRNFKVNVVPVSEIKLKFLYLPMYLTTNLPTYLPTHPSIHHLFPCLNTIQGPTQNPCNITAEFLSQQQFMWVNVKCDLGLFYDNDLCQILLCCLKRPHCRHFSALPQELTYMMSLQPRQPLSLQVLFWTLTALWPLY